MRKPLIAGNWKMNTNREEGTALVAGIAGSDAADCDILVCPPYVYLDAVGQAASGSGVHVGAQDVYFEESGAFTGEISCQMLADLGVTFVILGHSERRNVIGETDELINQKVLAVLAAGLTPILCVGELLEQREAGQTAEVVKSQFLGSLAGLSPEQMGKVVIAYDADSATARAYERGEHTFQWKDGAMVDEKGAHGFDRSADTALPQ